jgi:hypothetical protein
MVIQNSDTIMFFCLESEALAPKETKLKFSFPDAISIWIKCGYSLVLFCLLYYLGINIFLQLTKLNLTEKQGQKVTGLTPTRGEAAGLPIYSNKGRYTCYTKFYRFWYCLPPRFLEILCQEQQALNLVHN